MVGFTFSTQSKQLNCCILSRTDFNSPIANVASKVVDESDIACRAVLDIAVAKVIAWSIATGQTKLFPNTRRVSDSVVESVRVVTDVDTTPGGTNVEPNISNLLSIHQPIPQAYVMYDEGFFIYRR